MSHGAQHTCTVIHIGMARIAPPVDGILGRHSRQSRRHTDHEQLDEMVMIRALVKGKSPCLLFTATDELNLFRPVLSSRFSLPQISAYRVSQEYFLSFRCQHYTKYQAGYSISCGSDLMSSVQVTQNIEDATANMSRLSPAVLSKNVPKNGNSEIVP